MTLDNILYSCKQIAAISNIPIRVYSNGILVEGFKLDEFIIDPVIAYEAEILRLNKHVSCYISPFDDFYGVIKTNNLQLVIGPTGLSTFNRQARNDYAFKLGISLDELNILLKQLEKIPNIPIENLLHILLMINFQFNHEHLELKDIDNFFKLNIDKPVTLVELNSLKLRTSVPDNTPHHNSLAYEKELMALIQNGNVEELKQFITNSIHGHSGTLSDENIRHYKNIFIVSTTLASRAAIEGGIFESEAMQLSDTYIKKCETLYSVADIFQLQYQMILDYAERVSSLTTQRCSDTFIEEIVIFIKQNLSTKLDTMILANKFHISRNTLTIKFQNELGVTPATFICNERINRSKFLLVNTERSIIEIADYIGFSSQNHFQTKFKQQTDCTPKQYRIKYKK